MPKMVLCSKVPDKKIGGVYRGIEESPWSMGCIPLPKQCYRIVAVATEQDWIESSVSFGAPRDHCEALVKINGPWYYYEIQTD